MKRLLLSFMAAGGFALMAASPALAVNPLCGHSYAILIQGANPTKVSQDGSATRPGALTNVAGVGELTFDATCSVNTGTMILNQGDTQSANDPGSYVGPAHCYDGFGLFGPIAAQDGVPCFDGANHMSSVIVSPGAGNGSSTLTFTQTNGWKNGVASGAGSTTLSFIVQASTGGASLFGSSVSPAAATTVDLTKPVLTLTMQKHNTATCPTVYGVAPYLGNAVVSVASFGANGTDLVASSIAAGGNGSPDGGYSSTVGAVQFFNATQAGGSVTLNSNDAIENSAGTFPTGTSDCPFDLTPGNNCTAFINAHCTGSGTPYTNCTGAGTGSESCTPQPATAAFADCTANTIALFKNVPTCSLAANTPGVGFSQSSAVWGTTNTNAYFTNTAFIAGPTPSSGGLEGFTPGTGSEGAGFTIAQTPAGKLTTSATATQALTSMAGGVPVFKNIKLTSTTPATCDVTATLGGVTSDAHCALSMAAGSASVAGDTIDSSTVNIKCLCDATEDPGLNAASVQVTSSNCPIATGGGVVTVTCNN